MNLTVELGQPEPQDGGVKLSKPSTGGGSNTSGVGVALRLGTELVVATMIGVAMGYGLDHWLHSGPWFTVLFLFFGSAAGMRNVYRIVNSDFVQKPGDS